MFTYAANCRGIFWLLIWLQATSGANLVVFVRRSLHAHAGYDRHDSAGLIEHRQAPHRDARTEVEHRAAELMLGNTTIATIVHR